MENNALVDIVQSGDLPSFFYAGADAYLSEAPLFQRPELPCRDIWALDGPDSVRTIEITRLPTSFIAVSSLGKLRECIVSATLRCSVASRCAAPWRRGYLKLAWAPNGKSAIHITIQRASASLARREFLVHQRALADDCGLATVSVLSASDR